MRPEPPFTLGVDVAGTVVSAPSGVPGLEVGARVAGVVPYGGAGERAVVPASAVFPLPDAHVVRRGRGAADELPDRPLRPRERGPRPRGRDRARARRRRRGGHSHAPGGAAGSVPAPSRSSRPTEKAAFARPAGADEAVLVDGFKDAVSDLTGGRGVDLVLDVVGGEVFTDSLRCLAEQGRLLVVGFAAGQGIPEVKVNRLLLNNIDVRGVGWGAYAMTKPPLHARAVGSAAPDDRVRRRRAADRRDVRPRRTSVAPCRTWPTDARSARASCMCDDPFGTVGSCG